MKVRVDGVASLSPGEAKTFCFELGGEVIEAFVLRVRTEAVDGLVAFRNRCAHVGFDLDMGTGQFWSDKTQRVYCMTHGARFRPEDGVCDAGPCLGLALQRYGVASEGDVAIVEIDEC